MLRISTGYENSLDMCVDREQCKMASVSQWINMPHKHLQRCIGRRFLAHYVSVFSAVLPRKCARFVGRFVIRQCSTYVRRDFLCITRCSAALNLPDSYKYDPH